MRRHAIDRWTDTRTFRFMLVFASLAVVPVLAAGVLTTVVGAGAIILSPSTFDGVHAAFALLATGGVLGLLGYLRAHAGAKQPERHGVTATLICLAAGILAALAVVGVAVFCALELLRNPWDAGPWGAAPLLLAAANLVWVASGVAWMQRLLRRYTERTGRPFDSLPVVLLSVSIALAVAALVQTTTL